MEAERERLEGARALGGIPHAPWTVVPANAKWYRNLVVAESIVEALRVHRGSWTKTLAEMARKASASSTPTVAKLRLAAA